MLNIFRKNSVVRNTSGLKAPFALKRILSMMEINKETVLKYYRNKSKGVSTDDIIVRVLKFLNIKEEMSVFDVLEFMDMATNQIVRHFNIGSITKKAKEINGNYYLYEEDPAHYFDTKWEEFVPLRPLVTDYDSLLMSHPYKREGVLYILNLKLLAVQYLLFLKSKGSDFISIQEFVYRYVYTNSIPFFNSIALLNKLFNRPERIYKNPHPFHVIDFNESVDKIFEKYRKEIYRRKVLVQDVFLSINTLTGNGLTSIETEMQTFNGNNIKLYLLSYGHYIYNVLNLMSDTGKRFNKSNLTDFVTFYRYGITSRMDNYDVTFLERYTDETEDLIKYIKN